MTDDSAQRPRADRRRRRQQVGWVLIVVAVLIIGTGGWVAYTASQARDELTAVKAEIDTLQGQIRTRDFTAARTTASRIARHAERAHDLTTGPAWWTGSQVPYVGLPLQSVRGIALAADELATDVLPPLISAGQALEPGKLRLAPDQFDVAALQKLSAAVVPALDRVVQIAGDIDALPERTWLGQVDAARDQMSSALGTLLGVVRPAANALAVAPQLLGATSVQRYFVAFLNNAESRGLGGLPGAFGILVADHGKLSFEHLGTDDEMKGLTADVALPAEYTKAWAAFGPTTQYLNSDVDAHFPYSAEIWASMWQKKTGEKITAAMALDPTSLSYLLGAAGPTTAADGTPVSAANVVELTQKTAYDTFGDDQAARKAFLLGVASAVEKQIIGQGGSFTALVNAGARAAEEGRMLLWSADPEVERVLASGTIGGVVPKGSTPYAGVVVNNYAANKLDYYLSSAMTWKRTGCGSDRSVSVTLTFTNGAPATGLTEYVAGSVDGQVGNGDSKILVDYLATSGAQLRGATLDGSPTTIVAESERGHPVYRLELALPRGATQTLVLQLDEPAGTGAPVVRPAPLITPMTTTVSDAVCPSS